MRTQPRIDQGVCNSAASNFVFVFLSLAVKHTIQKSVSLLNKGWSYQANTQRLDSRLHCQSFDISHCHNPNRNFTHLEHCKGGINIRIAGTEAPPAQCGCGADVSRISSLSLRKSFAHVRSLRPLEIDVRRGLGTCVRRVKTDKGLWSLPVHHLPVEELLTVLRKHMIAGR